MKTTRKIFSAIATMALLITLCTGVFTAGAEDTKTPVNLKILNGTDTLSDLTKVSGWGGDISLYQIENGKLHLNYMSGGVISKVDKDVFGDIQAPWVSWNVRGGATVEFVGSINNSFSPNPENAGSHFRFQWTSDSITWTSLAQGTDVEFIQITSENIDAMVADHDLGDEGISTSNYNAYYSMTLPSNAIGVRVIYPEDMVDQSLAANGHWQLCYLMLRTSGGTDRALETDNYIQGEALRNLDASYVVSSSGLQSDQSIGGIPVLNKSWSGAASGAAVPKAYIVY